MKCTLMLITLIFLITPPTLASERIESLGSLPLFFIENQGQVVEEVDFYIQGEDKTLYFSSKGLTLALDCWTVKLDFMDAESKPNGLDQQAGMLSYFKGNREEWKTGIPTYRRIMYEELWPGIDLVYSGTAERLKYEFIVQPGADPNAIRLCYRGVSSLSVKPTGELKVVTPKMSFDDGVPYAYQPREGGRDEVSMHYALNDGMSFGFSVGSYDPDRVLVLDPSMVMYCGYIGGTGGEEGTAIAADDEGYLYVAGTTSSNEASFPVTAGPDLEHNGSRDLFVAKVNPDGTGLIYCGYIGGDDWDDATGVAVDSQGCAHVTGNTYSTEASFPVNVGPFLEPGGLEEAFVAKVSADGTALEYCGYIGGFDHDWSTGIALDSSGNVYISGGTCSDEITFPVLNGPDLEYNGGSSDAFVAKVKADGTALEYCGFLGGADADFGSGIAVDGAGSAFLTGYTWSSETTFPVKEGPFLEHSGGSDAFVAKVTADGTGLTYCGFIGGDSFDYSECIAVDGGGKAYIAGETWSTETTFPVKEGPELEFKGDYYDAFVARVDASGANLDYCGFIGGTSLETAFGIAVDGDAHAYVTGFTASSEAMEFPVIAGWDRSHNGLDDVFVAKLSADGKEFDFCGYIGGALDEYGYAVAVDDKGNTYVTGKTYTTQTSFPVRSGPYLQHNGGSIDAFVARILLDDKLSCDTYELSENGGSVNFTLDAGSANASRFYIVLGSVSGVAPGVPLPGGHATLPLVWDPFTDIIFSIMNTHPFTNFLGKLNASGKGAAQLNVPGLPSGFVGVKIFFAYALNNLFDFVSNPVEIEIVP